MHNNDIFGEYKNQLLPNGLDGYTWTHNVCYCAIKTNEEISAPSVRVLRTVIAYQTSTHFELYRAQIEANMPVTLGVVLICFEFSQSISRSHNSDVFPNTLALYLFGYLGYFRSERLLWSPRKCFQFFTFMGRPINKPLPFDGRDWFMLTALCVITSHCFDK